ncbi:hypothetical protein [Rhizobium azibense]|uniref:Uncharacterized protein n=1 Tax=Rhizobium azibense TaxID=1136135 RepID=A0A4R3RGG5_9HYPH|nr:hypothetical protein [Rhizobium azibense]TCU34101.1 hypothetical protein EV129_11384 [Rhizobium azibense]
MNKPLSAEAIRRLSVNLEDFFQPRREVAGKHAAPFSKTEDGRKRRDQRRKAIARKREFLN